MSDKFRISRVAFPIPVTAGGGTTFSLSATVNGILMQHKVKSTAAGDGTPTMTLNILDSDNDVVLTKTAIATNTTSSTLLTGDQRVPLSGTQTIQIVFSASQTTTSQTVTVTLIFDRA